MIFIKSKYKSFQKFNFNLLHNRLHYKPFPKIFCNNFHNSFYQRQKILGYNLIPEETYNLLLSKDLKISQQLIKDELILYYAKYNKLDFLEDCNTSNYLFLKTEIKDFIIANFNILPIFFNKNFIIKFVEEFMENNYFNCYLEDWILKPHEEKNSIINSENIKYLDFKEKDYYFYKPVIDLFVEYVNSKYSKEIETIKFLSTLTHNITCPHLWFPETRKIKRKIYLHIGNPNSGKTRFALNLLENSDKGIFITKNKHLSFEVYEKLKQKRKCDFVCEEFSNINDESTHMISTINVCDLSKDYKFAVIDEFHLISDEIHGFSFTNALLGLKCEDIHICVDENLIKLINNLCISLEDEIKIIKHIRESEIVFDSEVVQSVSNLKNGDCIVVDNLNELFEIKNKINKKYQKNHIRKINKCALLYCHMPLNIQLMQKSNFNNRLSSGTFLITTYETIKAGINLNIGRMVFSKLRSQPICEHNLRMVAGKAGNHKENGIVSAFRQSDLDMIRYVFKRKNSKFNELELVVKACLFPPLNVLKEFINIIKKYENKKVITISEILTKFETISKLDNQFIFRKSLINELHSVPLETDEDIDLLYHLITCPIKFTDKLRQQLCSFFYQYLNFKVIKLPPEFHLQNKVFLQQQYDETKINNLEEVNSILSAYICLSYSFPKLFIELDLAVVLQNKICNIIDSIISNKFYNPYMQLKSENEKEKVIEPTTPFKQDFDN